MTHRLILVLRTDRPKAEVGIYREGKLAAKIEWQAHRRLAETIHTKIEEILNKLSISLDDIEGIAVFKGPGSFTGLRIGFSVANALAYSLNVPVVATNGSDWASRSVKKLEKDLNERIALPEYGAQPRTAKPKK